MLRHEHGAMAGQDIECVHDMRVATRRLRASFEVFYEAFEPGALKPHLKGLRAAARLLGEVRDLDVAMEKARAYLENLPAEQRGDLTPLFYAWEKQREEARRRMAAHMESPDYRTFKRKFNLFLHTEGAGARPLPKDQPRASTVQELAPELIYRRLAAVRAYEPFLQNAPIERLHALRIECKKLRYTVEYFGEVLGPQADEVINGLKTLQDHLGDLNDAQVATQTLREFIDAWEPQQAGLPISQRQSLEAIVSYLAARHAELHHLMTTFYEVWKRVQSAGFKRKLAMAISIL